MFIRKLKIIKFQRTVHSNILQTWYTKGCTPSSTDDTINTGNNYPHLQTDYVKLAHPKWWEQSILNSVKWNRLWSSKYLTEKLQRKVSSKAFPWELINIELDQISFSGKIEISNTFWRYVLKVGWSAAWSPCWERSV